MTATWHLAVTTDPGEPAGVLTALDVSMALSCRIRGRPGRGRPRPPRPLRRGQPGPPTEDSTPTRPSRP